MSAEALPTYCIKCGRNFLARYETISATIILWCSNCTDVSERIAFLSYRQRSPGQRTEICAMIERAETATGQKLGAEYLRMYAGVEEIGDVFNGLVQSFRMVGEGVSSAIGCLFPSPSCERIYLPKGTTVIPASDLGHRLAQQALQGGLAQIKPPALVPINIKVIADPEALKKAIERLRWARDPKRHNLLLAEGEPDAI